MMPDVMERLRTETRDLHDRAERQEFQRRMVSGGLTRDDYVAWLGQMLEIHRALEGALAAHIGVDPRFSAVTHRQLQVPYLLDDLAALGADVENLRPLPATRSFIARIEADAESEPLRLLGYHYVLEGSNNGNRFIARALLPSLGLDRDSGGRYLDPYGAEQPAVWKAFKAEMSRTGFSADEMDRLVAAARVMFDAIADVSSELADSRPVVA